VGFQDSQIRFPLPDQSTASTTKTNMITQGSQEVLSSIQHKLNHNMPVIPA
jgi:hypothetical protein